MKKDVEETLVDYEHETPEFFAELEAIYDDYEKDPLSAMPIDAFFAQLRKRLIEEYSLKAAS